MSAFFSVIFFLVQFSPHYRDLVFNERSYQAKHSFPSNHVLCHAISVSCLFLRKQRYTFLQSPISSAIFLSHYMVHLFSRNKEFSG
jgi:hypothetical protein